METSSLYIHIPFCRRKCLFCSFTISVGQEHRRKEYVDALALEMKNYAGARLKSVYLGGGTPSMLDENHLGDLMEAVRKNFSFEKDAEMTIEANPESVNSAKAAFLKAQGFNRVSLGVQSLNGRYLKFLGRGHDAAAARQAYGTLRAAGLRNINLDLMYAYPGQTTEELEDDVRSICGMDSEHLSLYTLTIEPRSKFFASGLKLDDDEKIAAHYLLIGRILNEHGFRQYEISNFAKPHYESAHNRGYWLGAPYIGVGVGAHGFSGRRRYWNTSILQEYLARAARLTSEGGMDAVEGHEDLSDSQLAMERVLFGLRMNEGISWESVPSEKRAQVESWIKDGFFTAQEFRLKATEKGRLALDELSARLI
jgi:oxygen-independent coproporphyrinogen-3 oxidase